MLGKRYNYDGKAIIRLSQLQLKARNRMLENMKNEYRFVKVNCECGNNDYEVLSEKDRYGLPVRTVICKRCGLVYQNPSLDDESTKDFYSNLYRKLYGSSSISSYFQLQIKRGIRIRNWVYEELGYTPRTVIEIGCGAGGILKAFQLSGAKTLGVDFDEDYLEYGSSKGLHLKFGGVDEVIPHQADLVILSHVLEHFTNIEMELDVLKNILSLEGYLYVEVPGIFNLKPNLYDFLFSVQNAHNYYFTLGTLKQILRSYGWKLAHGNENIYSVFKYTENIDYCKKNYYPEIKQYLIYYEKMRRFNQIKQYGKRAFNFIMRTR